MTKQALHPAVFPYFDYGRYAFSLGVRFGAGAWLSGQTASRFDEGRNQMLVTGPIEEQAALATAKQGLILESGGFGFPDVVKLTDYVTSAGCEAYAEVVEQRKRLFGDRPPAVSTVVVDRLLRPHALIETEVMAARHPADRVHIGTGVRGMPAAAAVCSGDLLHCSALLPLDPMTGAVVPGGLHEQLARIYRNADAIMHEAGFAMSDVVRTVEYVHVSALDDYKSTWRVRAEHFGAPGTTHVAATGILMGRLAHADALIQVEFTAYRGTKQAIDPGWKRYERLTYCPAVRAGEYVFLSGQLALNPETGEQEHPGDVAGQVRYIVGNMQRVLQSAGLDLDDIVKTTEYITPAALPGYGDTASVRRELFSEPYPAVTGIVCEGLLRPGMLIEVDGVAVA